MDSDSLIKHAPLFNKIEQRLITLPEQEDILDTEKSSNVDSESKELDKILKRSGTGMCE